MNAGVFAFMLTMERDGQPVARIADLAGLSRRRPGSAMALAVLMFSLAGLPPMIGFFAKFFAFKAAVDAGLAPLAIAGVLASGIAAYYYLNIIAVMYLSEPDRPLEIRSSFVHSATLGLSALVMALGWLPMLGGFGVTELTAEAAQSLLAQSQARRESISGVNLDEEAANLIRFEQAYNASAQVISVARQIFDTLLASFR